MVFLKKVYEILLMMLMQKPQELNRPLKALPVHITFKIFIIASLLSTCTTRIFEDEDLISLVISRE